MRSKELWLVQENQVTVKPGSIVTSRGMKTYRRSRIELRNLLILKKMLEKSGQLLSSEQPCEPKSLDVVLNIAGVGKIFLWLRSTEVIWFEFWMKGALVTVGIFVFCGWWSSNQFDIMLETLLSCWPWAVVSYTLLFYA